MRTGRLRRLLRRLLRHFRGYVPCGSSLRPVRQSTDVAHAHMQATVSTANATAMIPVPTSSAATTSAGAYVSPFPHHHHHHHRRGRCSHQPVGQLSQSCPSIDFDCSEARKSHGGHNFVCLRNKCACESTCDGLGFVACGPDHCGGVCGACSSGK